MIFPYFPAGAEARKDDVITFCNILKYSSAFLCQHLSFSMNNKLTPYKYTI